MMLSILSAVATVAATVAPATPCSFQLGPLVNEAVSQTLPGVELEAVGHSIYGGGLYSQMLFDESFEDPKDQSQNLVTFHAPDNSTNVLRHCDGLLWSTPPIGLDDDHIFILSPPLNGNAANNAVSLQASNYPGFYVAPVVGADPAQLGVLQLSNNDTLAFRSAATFLLENSSTGVTLRATDGRYILRTGQLSNNACGFVPPASNVALGAVLDNVTAEAATWTLAKLPTATGAHWDFGGNATVVVSNVNDAFNGIAFATLVGNNASITSWGLYRRGLAFQALANYEGFVFLRNKLPNPVRVMVQLMAGNQTVLDQIQLSVPASGIWDMFNFSFMPTTATTNGSFFLGLVSPADSIDVDMVFLEPGAWGRYQGMHLRKDVADALLLHGALRSIRLDGTSVCANPEYTWSFGFVKFSRANVLAPTPTQWILSNGFGPFEVLQLAELANLDFVTIGINIWAETAQSCADFIDYLFGDATTTSGGRLRAADGHPSVYPATIVIELGNEEISDSYWSTAQPLLASMRARLQDVCPDYVGRVRFAIALDPVWAGGTAREIEILQSTAPFHSEMVWDQHGPGTALTDAASAFTLYDAMNATLRENGWTHETPMYIGETNCDESPEMCKSLNRALLYALYMQAAVVRPYVGTLSPAVWAYSTCDAAGTVCGATDGENDWPQESFIITPSGLVFQPSWHAHAMIAGNWGTKAFALESADAPACVSSIVLQNATHMNLHIVNVCATTALNASVAGVVPSCAASPRSLVGLSLTAASLFAYNSVAAPNTVAPVSIEAFIAGDSCTVYNLTLAPYSLTVLAVPLIV